MNVDIRARLCEARLVVERVLFVTPLAVALLAGPAYAQQAEAVGNSEVGHSTAAWLELQRSNAAAAPALPTLGAEAGYAYRRYLQSFETPIPPSFGSSVDTHGAGGGAGGATATSGEGGAY
jgi:hypothetical protein